jgi:hypothetical protein
MEEAMKHIKKIILTTLLLTSCTTQGGNLVSNSSDSPLSNTQVSSTTSAIDSAANNLLNQQVDQAFKAKLSEQTNKHGQLSMYQIINNQYVQANSIVRKKVLTYMLDNPRLDYYLNNKYVGDSVLSVLQNPNYVFISEDNNLGFRLPYAITLPEERFKEENASFKSYVFFEISNTVTNNRPYNGLYSGLGSLSNKSWVFNSIPNELYSPKVMAFIPQPCVVNTKNNEHNMARLLNRESILATMKDFANYKVCSDVGPGNDASTDNPDTFNEYIMNQRIDVEVQTKNIVAHAQNILRDLGYPVEDKFFIFGYSSSGSYTARFTAIYPELIKAAFQGGNNPVFIPTKQHEGRAVLFPRGVSDYSELFGKEFNLEAYNKVAKLQLMGINENWSNYPRDGIDNLDKTYYSFFGKDGVEQYLRATQVFYEYGGYQTNIFNLRTGHEVSNNDGIMMKEFFKNNRNNVEPWYPTTSPYPEHLVFGYKDLSNLELQISKSPAPTILPFIEGRILLFTSLSGTQTGGPHSDAIWRRFQNPVYPTQNLFSPSLIVEHNVFIVVYDTTMRSRLNLNDLKINITINPGEVVSTLNTDNKRVIVIYPAVDADGVKMIADLPSNITSVDQRYKR